MPLGLDETKDKAKIKELTFQLWQNNRIRYLFDYRRVLCLC